MITASVKFLNNSLLADLTCREYELYDHLQSIGILTAPNLITLDNARTVQIRLSPTCRTGELICSIVDNQKDTLGMVNRLCRNVYCMDWRDEDDFCEAIKAGRIKTVAQGLKLAERLRQNRRHEISR